MTVAELEAVGEPAPLRWSSERYLALVESGVIEDGWGIELIDGQVMTAMPQGKLHNLLFLALQEVLASMGAFGRGLAVQTTLVLQDGNVFDPEFALLRKEYDRDELPRAGDVLWVVEVSVTSRTIDLGPKKAAYAKAGIPEYWVVDALKRGVWVFTEPVDGAYRTESFVPAGESLTVPVIGAALDLGAIFPSA